uniref:Small nuclear RNA activating complex (SNAPc), subunit SNAP43 n=1 Tax=Strongyloides papillosus TaxID=174720 RepID=A0A0N5BA00_STREA
MDNEIVDKEDNVSETCTELMDTCTDTTNELNTQNEPSCSNMSFGANQSDATQEETVLNLPSEIFSKHEILRQYGILEDIKNFYRAYCAENSLAFYNFTKLYSEHNMSVLFLGKFAAYELVEISEYMLQYAAEFIVPLVDDNKKPYLPAPGDEVDYSKDNDPENLRKIIFGVYLCYMFYNSQPSQYVCNIHIQVRQIQEIQRIMKDVLLKNNQYEAMYCLYCLIQHEAFTIVPFGNDYTFKLAPSRVLPNDGSEKLASIKNFDLITSGGNLSAYKKETNFIHMQACHKKYLEMKKKFNMDRISQVKESPNEVLDNIEKHVTMNVKPQAK